MSKTRSPNFPVVSLQDAIDAVAKIYAKEKRGKFPKDSAARHLGYTSMNGRSLGMLAALRAYGLIDGVGDQLSVTADAIALIEAPMGGPDRNAALRRTFESPPMFARILAEYDEAPSEQTLKWWLIQQGFSSDGAENATAIFLESDRLVADSLGEYGRSPEAPPKQEGKAAAPDWASDVFAGVLNGPLPPKAPPAGRSNEELGMGIQERVLQSGMLSKAASYRVIVSGHVGEAELNKLIAKLEMDKDILADAERDAPHDEDRDPRD